MGRRPDGYLAQSKRYYVDTHNDIAVALGMFREDLETQVNVAAPIMGLFLAASHSVARLREAPLDEICDHDLPFARAVKGILEEGFRGLRFEATKTRGTGHDPWVGSIALQSCTFIDGFGYEPSGNNAPTSTDCLTFTGSGSERIVVDCADLVRSDFAPAYTSLRIPESRRGEVLERFNVVNPSLIPPPQPL